MTDKTLIKPTVGRMVWYRPHTYEMTHKHNQPLASIVTHVWSDTCVNLHVFGDNGAHLPARTSVTFAHGRPAQPGECEWPEHQRGQARAQQAEEVLKAVAVTGMAMVTPSGKVLDASEMLKPGPTMDDPMGQRCHACARDGRCAGRMMNCAMRGAMFDEGMEIMAQRRQPPFEAVRWPASEAAVEAMVQDKGLDAPRVTPRDLDNAIASEWFFTAGEATGMVHGNGPDTQALGLLTFCVLVLRNGFTVTGESACASPENFDAEVGRKVARENARNKLWPLLGYVLKDRLWRANFDVTRAEQIKAGCTD